MDPVAVNASSNGVTILASSIVDEKQQSTFDDSPWALEFVLFYLTLMNLGISVVLVGNPLAFVHLHFFSQVMRRFSTGGIHELSPATASDRWWERDFVPGARKANLVEHWDIDETERAKLEIQHCGRLPGLYMALHKEVMRQALRRGGKESTVTAKDFSAAVLSPRYLEVKKIALSISDDDGSSASEFLDIPPLHEKRRGIKDETSRPPVILSEGEMASVTRLLTNFKSAQTRLLNNEARRLKALQSLEPEDARMLGISGDLLISMQAARTAAEAAKKIGQKPGPKVNVDAAP